MSDSNNMGEVCSKPVLAIQIDYFNSSKPALQSVHCMSDGKSFVMYIRSALHLHNCTD